VTQSIQVGDTHIQPGGALVLIAGPCVIESRDVVMHVAEKAKAIADRLGMPMIFKSSYTKDNRSTISSYQGPGIEEGLKILQEVKEQFALPVLSDVHTPDECAAAAEVLDVLQIPAYLSMQSSLVIAAAKTGRAINVKKGQFLHPLDMKNVVGKIEACGNRNIMLTERGTCLGYHNLVADMRSLPMMRSLGYPVVFDPTHTVRKYGVSSADPAGGEPQYIPHLTRAGVAAGVDVLFIETHPDPPSALCDAASMLPLSRLETLLSDCVRIHEIARAADSQPFDSCGQA
jgi:2-dehydro-3-deoxyphosphooctonate aldolase (KDO 8-P synthase)